MFLKRSYLLLIHGLHFYVWITIRPWQVSSWLIPCRTKMYHWASWISCTKFYDYNETQVQDSLWKEVHTVCVCGQSIWILCRNKHLCLHCSQLAAWFPAALKEQSKIRLFNFYVRTKTQLEKKSHFTTSISNQKIYVYNLKNKIKKN